MSFDNLRHFQNIDYHYRTTFLAGDFFTAGVADAAPPEPEVERTLTPTKNRPSSARPSSARPKSARPTSAMGGKAGQIEKWKVSNKCKGSGDISLFWIS